MCLGVCLFKCIGREIKNRMNESVGYTLTRGVVVEKRRERMIESVDRARRIKCESM